MDTGSTWKTDEEGGITLKDGNPVFVDSSGREMVIQTDTISKLNGEAKTHREARQAAEARLKEFEGLDAATAREAVEKMSKVDAKQLIDAGKVDEVKNQIKTEYQKQLEERDGSIKSLQQKIDNMLIDDVFNRSDFVRNNIAVPPDMFTNTFRQNFKVEDGKVIPYDKSGNIITSKENFGEVATPDEALRILVENHPHRDQILRADGGSGSGSDGGGSNRSVGRNMKRSDFEKLPPNEQAGVAGKVRSGEMKLTD